MQWEIINVSPSLGGFLWSWGRLWHSLFNYVLPCGSGNPEYGISKLGTWQISHRVRWSRSWMARWLGSCGQKSCWFGVLGEHSAFGYRWRTGVISGSWFLFSIKHAESFQHPLICELGSMCHRILSSSPCWRVEEMYKNGNKRASANTRLINEMLVALKIAYWFFCFLFWLCRRMCTTNCIGNSVGDTILVAHLMKINTPLPQLMFLEPTGFN